MRFIFVTNVWFQCASAWDKFASYNVSCLCNYRHTCNVSYITRRYTSDEPPRRVSLLNLYCLPVFVSQPKVQELLARWRCWYFSAYKNITWTEVAWLKTFKKKCKWHYFSDELKISRVCHVGTTGWRRINNKKYRNAWFQASAAKWVRSALLWDITQRMVEHQLDATECFIALIICSTCFGHLYVHHQQLETILVLLPHMLCDALVAGGRLLGAEQQAMRPGWGKLCDWDGHISARNMLSRL